MFRLPVWLVTIFFTPFSLTQLAFAELDYSNGERSDQYFAQQTELAPQLDGQPRRDQDGMATEVRARQPQHVVASVELKPIPAAVSALADAGGIGLGMEFFGTPRVHYVVQGSWLSADMPSNLLRNMREQTNDPIPESLDGYTIGVGARYYDRPVTSSWYAGANMSYLDASSVWNYENETIDARGSSFIPSVDGGYRWLQGRNQNFLIRLGAQVGANLVQRNVALTDNDGGEVADRGRQRVNDLQATPIIANLDLGVGYRF